MMHMVKGFGIVNRAEVDVFLEFCCLFDDPRDVGNLISGFSAFSESSLNIWKFSIHILLKPSLENLEHYFASVWDECNCVVVGTFFCIDFLWDWNKNWPCPVLRPLLSFPILLDIEFSSVGVQLCDTMDCSTSDFPIHHQLLELTQTHVHWFDGAIQASYPLSSPSPHAFQWVISLYHLAIYWSFSVSISPSNEYSGLISSRIDSLDLLAVQGSLKSLLHTTVQKHQFFSIQLSS